MPALAEEESKWLPPNIDANWKWLASWSHSHIPRIKPTDLFSYTYMLPSLPPVTNLRLSTVRGEYQNGVKSNPDRRSLARRACRVSRRVCWPLAVKWSWSSEAGRRVCGRRAPSSLRGRPGEASSQRPTAGVQDEGLQPAIGGKWQTDQLAFCRGITSVNSGHQTTLTVL